MEVQWKISELLVTSDSPMSAKKENPQLVTSCKTQPSADPTSNPWSYQASQQRLLTSPSTTKTWPGSLDFVANNLLRKIKGGDAEKQRRITVRAFVTRICICDVFYNAVSQLSNIVWALQRGNQQKPTKKKSSEWQQPRFIFRGSSNWATGDIAFPQRTQSPDWFRSNTTGV